MAQREEMHIKKVGDEVIIQIKGYSKLSIKDAVRLLYSVQFEYAKSDEPITDSGLIATFYIGEQKGTKTAEQIMEEIENNVKTSEILSDKWFKRKFHSVCKSIFKGWRKEQL